LTCFTRFFSFAHDYPDEYKTLPPAIVSKRVEIDPQEIIAVRRYDRNGAMEYMPAIYLLQLEREYETNTAGKIQAVAGADARARPRLRRRHAPAERVALRRRTRRVIHAMAMRRQYESLLAREEPPT
jgi:hypothetical protein